ncbi:hypothetical protein KGF56_001346 [Candida oxycetoniae]|uniref:Vacuolar membrane protein n=1 Tax=Candida oxycetoniae TaxID=497107 RepID=A0AAI9WZ66_9ASCO|nr:uncharacterized protein KGF56_001346 [Candida oxycetoniae]KAI3405739.2 hypothetical protein KGF56_001346 [Candida oxycetoniae]
MRDPVATILSGATTMLTKRDDGPSTTGMPAMDMPTLTDSGSFTTPVVSVPPNNNNPFIIRQNNPSGTVFIAVGAIVGSILLGFILYHLILSLSASRMAKRTSAYDRHMYEKYQNNNNNAYGFAKVTPTSTLSNFVNEYSNNHHQAGSISKLPLLNKSFAYQGVGGGSQAGDNSTIYQSEIAAPTSKHDLTKMFISPTAEVMQQKRFKAPYNQSLTNLAFGGSTSNLSNPSPASNRHSQLVPSLYIDNEMNNSDYSLAQSQFPHQQGALDQNDIRPRPPVPSMYLEDLIDKK